ncbi:hypothetical protein CBER1_07565 [Cercospora berteroae]|uniref:NTF2-like domain-containing protein n=1 Tax=Cercospora berteroae TaxID=357750 RepID=A0A2S6CK54_9PEZI|nr:hypothetical protein CBER1_07565 [Cercospora berteroae]
MAASPAVFFLKALFSLPFVSIKINNKNGSPEENLHIESSSGNTNESCLTRVETAQIIEKYTLYLTKYPDNRTVLEELVDENVTAASDSLSYVFQKPLNTTLARNLQEMLKQEAAVPAVPSVNTIFVSNTCDIISWYWEFTTKPYPTRGIVILFVNLQLRKLYKNVPRGEHWCDSGQSRTSGVPDP